LWAASGVLLASTFVDNSDPLTGFWRFDTLSSAVTLVAGQNYVVGSQGGEGYTWNVSGFTVDPNITFVQDRWINLGNSNNTPLSFPNQTDNRTGGPNQGFFGGNVEFADATAAPEPSSLALFGMAITTFAGYSGWRRRKQSATV